MANRVVPGNALNGANAKTAAADTSTTGQKAVYTCPAGKAAVLRWISWVLLGGTAPTVALRVRLGGTTVAISIGSTSAGIAPNISLDATDFAEVNCTTGGAGSTADCMISVEEYPIG